MYSSTRGAKKILVAFQYTGKFFKHGGMVNARLGQVLRIEFAKYSPTFWRSIYTVRAWLRIESRFTQVISSWGSIHSVRAYLREVHCRTYSQKYLAILAQVFSRSFQKLLGRCGWMHTFETDGSKSPSRLEERRSKIGFLEVPPQGSPSKTGDDPLSPTSPLSPQSVGSDVGPLLS